MSNEIVGLAIGCRDFSEEEIFKIKKAIKYAKNQYIQKIKKQKAKRK